MGGVEYQQGVDFNTFALVISVIFIYAIPIVAAAGREGGGGPMVVGIFLGWTLLGWVIALAWALSLPKRPPPKPVNAGSGKPRDPQKVEYGPDGTAVPATATSAGDTRACPFCAEEIKPAAIVCKHCGRDLA